MSEPDLTGSGEFVTDKTHPDWDESETGCAEVVPTQVGADALGADESNQRERIEQLEQALEQSLASISELKLQLKDQHLLETQLAATEEIANIQQQAINELQRQLMQQQSLEVESAAKHPALPEKIRFPLKYQPLRVDLPAFLTKRQGHSEG